MARHTSEHIKKVLEAALEKGETLQEFCYALKGFRGHALGLTGKRLVFVRLSLFRGRPVEQWELKRSDIADVQYDERSLSFKTKDGKEYKFMMTGTAGLEGEKNFEHARALYTAFIA